jgi:hypothetical protein
MTKKEKNHPIGGSLGRALQNILIPDKSVEVICECHVTVFDLTSAVTPSSDDEPPLVLVILDG